MNLKQLAKERKEMGNLNAAKELDELTRSKFCISKVCKNKRKQILKDMLNQDIAGIEFSKSQYGNISHIGFKELVTKEIESLIKFYQIENDLHVAITYRTNTITVRISPFYIDSNHSQCFKVRRFVKPVLINPVRN